MGIMDRDYYKNPYKGKRAKKVIEGKTNIQKILKDLRVGR